MVPAGTSLRTCLAVAERNLRDQVANEALLRIAEGRVARCLLPFIPLMQGGAEASIIERWKQLRGQSRMRGGVPIM